MLLDEFHNKYVVIGTLKAKAPIHIGAGNSDFDPLQVDNTIIRDNDGNPYIPGSSIKGVLRSYMETLIQSIDYPDLDNPNKKLRACFIVNDPCLKNEFIEEVRRERKRRKEEENIDKEIANKIYNEMCDVCKIFGSNYFASKLKIKDCKLKDEKAYVEKRDGVVIDRETGTSLDGRKYDFEQVAAGTNFDFYMTIDNLEKKHEELFKLIVSLLKNGELKIGGKTSVGLGTVKLENYDIYKLTKENIKEYLLNGFKDEMRWENV
ncbi:CRISPR-associated protein, Csx7 family [Clostridium cochlearium]|uniref:CRISPR-associated protein, Csx7 family n=1 Tax=Clostridium cochlearium TaxID=1494 RepID=A0ABY0QP26_CLOCO|nr:CRISPR-associated RAMP protein Csx7 [Clostridium cochlearium]SDL41887.1 CRISPR-associated protein, Csx7 family [Clostridium cochlearium]